MLFRLSRRRVIADYEIGALLTEGGAYKVIEAKCTEALALLQTRAPRAYQRLIRHTDGALVFSSTEPRGEWIRPARLMRLQETFVTKPTTQPAHIAATMVHEATHAWLNACGFIYTPDRRRRIEAVCIRAQAAFARQLDGGHQLAEYYEARAQEVLGQSDAQWSDAALAARAVDDLRDIGTPTWLVRIVARCIGRTD